MNTENINTEINLPLYTKEQILKILMKHTWWCQAHAEIIIEDSFEDEDDPWEEKYVRIPNIAEEDFYELLNGI